MAFERLKKFLPPPSEASKEYALYSALAGGASFYGVLLGDGFLFMLYGLASGYFGVCTITNWKAGAHETTRKIRKPNKPKDENIILPYNLTLSRK